VTQINILVGADAFAHQLISDLQDAKDRAFIQAMTFEGDEAGHLVARAIHDSAARDRRVLVDRYTRFVLSDRFIFGPGRLANSMVVDELRATMRMFDQLTDAGVGVRWTNPMGLLMWRLPLRNHKKLMVIDDVVYIGGINFSDHNFRWDDLMVRIHDRDVAAFFANDFVSTFDGRPMSSHANFGDLDGYCLDGRNNPQNFASILDIIGSARSIIRVVSPYLTFPFSDHLASARRRGVTVQILTPANNNKAVLANAIRREACRSDFELYQIPGMQHFKCLLIDDSELVLGSSNFDFISYWAQEEIVVTFRSPKVIKAVMDDVITPLIERAGPQVDLSPLNGRRNFADAALRLAALYARLCRKTKRGIVG
jgi:cardiolipin synthase